MNKIIENNILEKNNSVFNIAKGYIISIIITLILLFIFSAILTYTNISENVIAPVIIVITAISILIGSQISSVKIKKNGIINGGIVGLMYILSIYIISSIVGNGFELNAYAIGMIIASVLAGMLGGIIGVNMR